MLAFACAFTMFAGAASFTDEADIQALDAVNMLTTLGVIQGYEDNSFQPDGVVTRAEMAKMIFVVRNNTADDKAYANVSTSLTDISGHWAEGYIKFCESQGIIAGKGNGIFDPDATVTGTEAAKMLLVLAGYEPSKAGLEGSAWATNTLRHAGAAGILDKVSSALESGLPRQWAAQMIYNTLSASRVIWSADSQSFDTVLNGGIKETVGRAYMGLYNSIGTLVHIDMDRLAIVQNTADENESDPIDTIWDGSKLKGDYATNFTKVATDYADLLGQKVRVMFKNGHTNEVLGVFPIEGNTVYTVAANTTSKNEDRVSFDGNSYRLDNDNGIATYVNGVSRGLTTLTDLDRNALNPNMYTFVDSDGNGRLDTLVVKTYTVAKVTYADSAKIIANGYTYQYDNDNIADDIANGDWIVVTRNLFNDNNDIVKAEVQTATLDALRNNKSGTIHFDYGVTNNNVAYNQYQIGDNWYNGGEGANALSSAVSENDLNAVKAGETVDYVAVNGIMFYVKKSTGTANGRVDNVAMVLKKDDTDVSDRARLLLFNGDEITVDVSDRGDVKYEQLEEGVVYEYSVSGGQYRFEKLKEGVTPANQKYEEYYGDLTYRGDIIEADADPSTGAKWYNDATQEATTTKGSIDGKVIDDNAQIILFSMKDGTTVKTATMTGKQYKALDLTDIKIGGVSSGKSLATKTTDTSPISNDKTGDIVAYAFSGNMGGLDRIGALAIQVTDGAALDQMDYNTWTGYGFIINDPKFVDGSGRKIVTYDILTDAGVVTVQEDRTTLMGREKNTLIGFNSLETKDDVTTIDEVDQLTAANSDLYMDAIKSVATNGNTFTTYNNADIDVSGAVKLYVNTKDGEAVLEGGVAQKATQDSAGNYLANVLYLLDEADDAAVVVYEQADYLRSDVYETGLIGQNLGNGGVIYGGDAVWSTGSDSSSDPTGTEYASVTDIVRALVNAPAGQPVVVNGIIPAGSFNVPANKIVKLDGYVSGNLIIGGDGKVVIGDNFSIDSLTDISVPDVEVKNALPAADWTVNGEITATANSLTAAQANALLAVANTTVKAVSDTLSITDGHKLTVTGNVNGDVTVDDAAAELAVGGNVAGSLTVTNAAANGVVVTGAVADEVVVGAHSATVGSIGDYAASTSTATTGKITITGNVTSAITLPAGMAGTTVFNGDVTAAITLDAKSVVEFGKSIDITTVIDAVAANKTQAGAKLTFKVAPKYTTPLAATDHGFFATNTTADTAVANAAAIQTNKVYTNTANKGAGTINAWVPAS